VFVDAEGTVVVVKLGGRRRRSCLPFCHVLWEKKKKELLWWSLSDEGRG
jgi:hypothetical protein